MPKSAGICTPVSWPVAGSMASPDQAPRLNGGAIVAGHQVILNSGYGLFSQAPGNVLLVYGATDRSPSGHDSGNPE
jgi:hypothetical protein